MELVREKLQVFVRRFGLLNASCCEVCCGEQVSLVQSHILFEVRRMESPSMQRVAEELGMDVTTFSRQVKTLERKGLIGRRVSSNDRRVTLLKLTDEGKRVLAQIDRYMTAKLEQIFSFLTPFEREAVIRSLELLSGAVAQAGCSSASSNEMVACCN